MGHKDNFPNDGEVVRRLEELEERGKYTNRILVGIIVGSMGTILSFGIWVGSIQTMATNNQEDITELASDHHQIETRLGNLEVNNSEIKARLISIEATLQEIKSSIGKLR